jgi:CubicO group peptidase (beta-lactamase class C family)
MPGQARSLPSRPSLRYLKLEAKRRLAAREFPTLHDAQAAIAREYGLPGWAALKQRVASQSERESHALTELRWVVARFRDAGEPGWAPPGEHELRQHFSDQVLNVVPAAELVAALVSIAPDLHGDLVVVDWAPLGARARIEGTELLASAEAGPPHRLTGVTRVPLGSRITDARVAAPPAARTLGDVPAEVAGIADWAFAELGLVGLILAGGGPGTRAWAIAKGWANLERAEVLDTGHRLPASGVAALVTTTAVLRLVADGRFGLDTPANDHLRTVRLADDTITVRELLSHRSGIDNVPANPAELYADSVPDLVALTGPVIGCGGPRGEVRPANSGCAVLGQLVADVTGWPYADAATRLVLQPLGMSRSSFPARAADIGPDAVTGYSVTAAGTFEPAPAGVCVMPAAGGLWATAADLVRLGTRWSSLLPAALAREALAPQAPGGRGDGRAGLGWIIRPRGETAFLAGASFDSAASLSVRIRGTLSQLIVTNRAVPVDAIERRMVRSWTNPAHSGLGETS